MYLLTQSEGNHIGLPYTTYRLPYSTLFRFLQPETSAPGLLPLFL
jgi:hypothetical protein